jgi:glycosyltransferase involved in cell wall biosynthesis
VRVLIVCDWFLKVVHGQALALRELGHDVALLCRSHADEYGGDSSERAAVLEELVRAGVSVGQLEGRRVSARAPRDIVRARRWVARHRPDVVHAHENFDPRLFAATRGLPSVLTVHDPVAHPGDVRRSALERVTRMAWRGTADRVVVHGEGLRVGIGRRPAGVLDVVPHGIAMAEGPYDPPATPAVLLFGRLEPYKGVDVLVEAMRIVWRERPDVHLLVYGRGPALELVPRDEPRIVIRDRYIREEELDESFAAATVVTLPYTQASQSGVGLEALARGVPVVVTSVGALQDLAMEADWIVPPGDHSALAAALMARLDDSVRYRSLVHDFASRRFSWPAVAARYAGVYERAVARGHST